jgi:chromosomal replication initiation ATPase DnaA
MTQIALPFAWPADPAADEFVIGESNARAAQALERWGAWPVMAALLVGPRKSGRSLLARIFAAKSGARIVDDAERVAEAQIFHAWNAAQADRRPLLIVADAPPPEWQIALPDLRSRLAATPVLRLGPPDDALMRALLERAFLRRGLDARPELIQWLTARLERDHVVLQRAVDVLDQEVLESRKRLSIPLARTTLEMAGLLSARSGDET